jgi:protein O-mannosyl-transferase
VGSASVKNGTSFDAPDTNHSSRNHGTTAGLLVPAICVFLAVITWLVFGQTLRHDFVDYDDNTYVYANPVVANGVTQRSIGWAFTHSHVRNWHPLTTISHMVDCQLYGLKAGGHHFTNVLLHTVAVLLLFLLLRQMTGALWRSAFVAAVFAIHPLHVESVAWIAERKDMLSGVFFMLTLGAYVRYARNSTFGRYVAMSILFALGLISKPMLVTLPFVLLLLDYWPLGRSLNRGQKSEVRSQTKIQSGKFEIQSWLQLVLEKIPLLVLAAGSCIATLLVQTKALNSFLDMPLRWRINNSLVAFVTYVWQMFWPSPLAVFYPHPYDRLPFSTVVFAAALLLAITVTALALRKQRPYLIIGWLWYLIMLMPVIGIVQVGDQARADRYTYLPQIGLYIAVTWAVVDLCARWRYCRPALTIGSTIIIAALAACASKQTTWWRDSESLWTHTLAVTSNNSVAHIHLGTLLLKRGQVDAAISHFRESLSIRADANDGRANRGKGLVHYDLGNAFAQKGLMDAAIVEYKKAVQLAPDYSNAHSSLGAALLKKGEVDEAIAQCREALSIEPEYAGVHSILGNALVRKGKVAEAVPHYERSLEIAPQSATTLNDLAWVLSTCSDGLLRNGARAIELAKKAVELSERKNPIFLRTLAAAYAEGGRFNDAIDTAQTALQLALAQGNSALATDLQMDIDLYRMNFPRRDRSLTNVSM